MHVILMGAQGSGKGTQAVRLAPRLQLQHLSTGELFRAAIAARTPVGQEIEAAYDRGDLISDELTVRLVGERLDEITTARTDGADVHGAMFDGFPRTVAQAQGLDRLMQERGEEIGAVIELVVPAERLIARLSGRRVCPACGATYHQEFNPPAVVEICDVCGTELVQRDDDQPEPIKRRLTLYFEQTAPVVAFYANRGLLAQVDGDKAIDEVTEAIKREVRQRTQRVDEKASHG